jgi:hypothetical protein
MELTIPIWKNKKQLRTEYYILIFSDSGGIHIKYLKDYGIGCSKTIWPRIRPWYRTLWKKNM